MPPPYSPAVLPLMVLLLMIRVESTLEMPPPQAAALPLMVQLLIVSSPCPSLTMPPPYPPAPLVMVRLEIVTFAPGHPPVWKTLSTALPFTVRRALEGPAIMRLFPGGTLSLPLVNVIVAGVVTEKSMVSPLLASAIAWRKEPVPLSLVLVTVMVAARTLSTPTRATQS